MKILVTVGSMFPFDRLIHGADVMASKLPNESIVAQIGDGAYEPRHMPFERFLPRARFVELLRDSDVVISHAGIGTISEALRFRKPLMVLPRRHSLGEAVNDHQVNTANHFQKLRQVLIAHEPIDFAARLDELRRFEPAMRQPDVIRLVKNIDLKLRQWL